MDIVYIVGNRSCWANNELRYSLRSIETYGVGIDRVIISGYCPDFIDKYKVIHVPCFDIYNTAHKNILYKTKMAMSTLKLTEPFWISSDDHFYISTHNFSSPRVYFRNEVIDESPGKCGNYFESLRRTKEYLLDNDLPVFQTNPHCDTLFSPSIYNEYKELFDKSFDTLYGLEMNCLMGNLLITKGFKRTLFNDAKLKSGTPKSLAQLLSRTFCISSYDNVKGSWLDSLLQSTFKNRSKYELPVFKGRDYPAATTINSWLR